MRGGWKGVAVTALVLGGCGARSGPDLAPEVTSVFVRGDGGGRAGGVPGSGATAGEGSLSTCRARDLGVSLGAPVAEGVLAGTSSTASACGGGGPEARHRFRAPVSGTFRFDTRGSGTSTVLSIATEPCGASGRCASGGDGLMARVDQGQTIEIVVDTEGTGGGYVLNALGPVAIDSGCPGPDLGSRVGAGVWADRLDGPRYPAPIGCGPVGEGLVAHWTAPHAGVFAFDTTASTFATVLEVRAGPCPGALLACNVLQDGLPSHLEVSLGAGQTVVVLVGAQASGPTVTPSLDHFVLNVTDATAG